VIGNQPLDDGPSDALSAALRRTTTIEAASSRRAVVCGLTWPMPTVAPSSSATRKFGQ